MGCGSGDTLASCGPSSTGLSAGSGSVMLLSGTEASFAADSPVFPFLILVSPILIAEGGFSVRRSSSGIDRYSTEIGDGSTFLNGLGDLM